MPDEEFFESLTRNLSKVHVGETVCICDDLNCRIESLQPSKCDPNSSRVFEPVTDLTIINVDRHQNGRGSTLLRFCDSHSLVPLNGLKFLTNTYESKYTYVRPNGVPVVDYIMTAKRNLIYVKGFSILDSFDFLSDHRAVSAIFSIQALKKSVVSAKSKKVSALTKKAGYEQFKLPEPT